jgi:hypothetical protein
MRFPTLFRKEISDEFAQENFKRVMDYFSADPMARSSFEFIEIHIAGPVTGVAVPHHLGFVPKDIILTQNLTNATVTFNYAEFTVSHVYVNSSTATTLRLMIGRYT